MEGTVIVEFTVTANGSTDFSITRDIGYGCGAEVVAALKKSKKWSPAIVSGKNIPQRVAIEVPFKLEN